MRRHLCEETGDVGERDGGAGGIVGVADEHEPCGDGELAQHGWQVVALVTVERDCDGTSAGGSGEVRVDGEGRPGVDELGAWLEQRLAGSKQDVAGAVADGDARRGHAVTVAERLTQQRV